MEGSSPKSPLLGKDGRRASRRGLLSRRNSVNSLRTEFVTRLPDKVRCGLDLESDSFDLDLSRTRGLTKGEKEYYGRQFETLKSFEEVDTLTTPAENRDDYETLEEEEAQELAQHERAMRISNYANVALLALKVVSRSITVSRLE
ncbi:hypothetical protein SLA2020_437690 [Shorea laevis]